METSGGIQASLAGRYATALFGLARDEQKIDAVTRSLDSIEEATRESADFRALTTSPLVSRGDASKAVRALVPSLQLDPVTANFLGVLAHNRRLSALPAIIRDFTRLSARARGEITAEVTSAHALDEGQRAALKAKLRAGLGADADLILHVDPEILGGLIVRVGSRMIDSSLRTKLNSLATAMKG